MEIKKIYQRMNKFQEKGIILGEENPIICPICNLTINKILYDFNDFKILRCKKCGLKIRNKIPKNKALEEYYNIEDYWKTSYFSNCFKDYNKTKPEIKHFMKVLNFLEQKKGKGRLIDIGCATGVFLHIAKRKGWIVQGVEVSKYAAEYGREKFGINIKNLLFEKAKYPEESFDVVMSFEVVEHVRNPEEFIKHCNKILKKDGLLVLMTPDHNSLIAIVADLLYGLSFKKYKFPLYGIYDIEHITYLSPKTLNLLLEKNGFSQVNLFKESLDLERSREVQGFFYKIGMRTLIIFAKIFNKQFKFTGVYKKNGTSLYSLV